MGVDPISIAAGAAIVGSAISGAASLKSSRDQKKAARAAAQAAADAADTSATVSTSQTAATPTETQAGSERAIQTAAKRRMSVSDTVNKFASNGMRRTLN